MEADRPRVAGLVLAGGAGRRFGRPKALMDGWLAERVEALVGGGCESVFVVLGAAADEARQLVPAEADVLVVLGWAEGMGATLRAGLVAVDGSKVDAVLVALVDTPGLTAQVVSRVLHPSVPEPAEALAQAAYGGVPGHPVLIGRSHWDGVLAVAQGDRGARDYLRVHDVALVECGDVGDGRDVDVPGQWSVGPPGS